MSDQIFSHTTGSVAGRSDSRSYEPHQTMNKMVDRALTLEMDPEDDDIVNRTFNTLSLNECTLNQCLSYICKSALFTNLEIKRQAGSDPELQLVLRESAALKETVGTVGIRPCQCLVSILKVTYGTYVHLLDADVAW